MTQPRSIHDADSADAAQARRTRPVRKRRLRAALAVVVAVAAVAGAGLWWSNGAHQTPAPQQTAADGVSQVFIDGWSLRTLEDRALTFTADGRTRPLTFEPVTGQDLDALLASRPDLVTAAVARQLDGDPSLECDKAGCRTHAGAVSVHDLLLKSSSDPVKMLSGVGVETGLLVAHVPSGPVTISADGYTDLDLTPPIPGVDPEADTSAAAGEGGVLDTQWLISAGLGRIFETSPQWLGAESRDAWAYVHPGALPGDGNRRVLASAPVLAAPAGLGPVWDLADNFTPAQLTVATSPTKGCDAGILCYPGTLPVTTQADPLTVVPVGAPGQQDALVAVEDRVVSVDLPAPIRQVGEQEPIQGQVQVRMVTAVLFTGVDADASDWAGLIGVDDGRQVTVDEVLTNVRLAGHEWSKR